MATAVENSYCLATDLLDYLVLKGVYFKDAHEIMAKLTKYCTQNKKFFHNLQISEFKEFSDKFDNDVYGILQLDNILYNHKTAGSPNPNETKKMITNLLQRYL